jgi:hypothetical protein
MHRFKSATNFKHTQKKKREGGRKKKKKKKQTNQRHTLIKLFKKQW